MKSKSSIELQIKSMPDYMLQTRINGQTTNENSDATLIAITSIMLAISTYVLAGTFIKYIILLAFIALLIQYILSFINIYIRFHPKYAVGDSYVARKLFTAAVPYFLYSLIVPYIIYDTGLLWIALFFMPYIFSSPLINSLWRMFDNLKYAQIDLDNPNQRRSYFETKEHARMYQLCKEELLRRELNKFTEVNQDLEDIEIRRRESWLKISSLNI